MDPKHKIDQVLIKETIEGNISAYDSLYLRYKDPVLSMLLVKCGGNNDLAKDLMQESFIKAFVNIKKHNPKYNFGPWITTIARNLFIDYTRRRHNEPVEIEKETPSDLPDPEQQVISSQNTSAIETAIGNIPKHYRTIFTLRYLDDMSYDEISEKLSMPLGTVKTQLHRSRARFLSELGFTKFD